MSGLFTTMNSSKIILYNPGLLEARGVYHCASYRIISIGLTGNTGSSYASAKYSGVTDHQSQVRAS